MRQAWIGAAALGLAALAGSVAVADVKTREKTSARFEGFVGTLMRMGGGGGESQATIAVRGSRLSRVDATTGQIIDLAEEKVYNLDVRRKEYTVVTFAEMRQQMEEARRRLEEQRKGMPPNEAQALESSGKEIEADVSVKETGQKRAVAGHDAREVVLTIALREKGKTLEESGGFVMTNTLWLGPKIAALDEIAAFQMKFVKAVYGSVFTGVNAQQAQQMSALLPGFATLSQRMAEESRKLQGSPLASTSVLETVRSAEALKQGSTQAPSSGGIGGALAGRLLGNRGAPQPRSKAFTMNHEYLSVETAAADADVQIPTGYKEKK
jgi:hypothetical protein